MSNLAGIEYENYRLPPTLNFEQAIKDGYVVDPDRDLYQKYLQHCCFDNVLPFVVVKSATRKFNDIEVDYGMTHVFVRRREVRQIKGLAEDLWLNKRKKSIVDSRFTVFHDLHFGLARGVALELHRILSQPDALLSDKDPDDNKDPWTSYKARDINETILYMIDNGYGKSVIARTIKIEPKHVDECIFHALKERK